MVGLLITLLFAAGATGAGLLLFRPLLKDLDPALRLGTAALLGLGFAGFITLPIGLLPQGVKWGIGVMALIALAGLYILYQDRDSLKLKSPQGPWLFIPLAIALAALMALIGALTPSDMNEWDALAYHLAVPKLWVQHGRIDFIPYIHHSNFPFAVDNLYIWGLQWGGQSGAKAFQLAFYLAGMAAVFGLARQRYGQPAAWWSLLAYATIPAAMWEAGTAYIDLAHGLYAGLGILFAALWLDDQQKSTLWLSALMLGLAVASKYTG
ncbi:MAG: glycosyltransferase family 39 protein, partial [Fimbriimonas sp.]